MADEKMENLSVEAGIPDPSLLLRCSTQPSKESGAHVEKGAVTDNCVPNGFVRHCSEGEIISKLDSREQSLDKSAGDTATDSEKTSNCNIVTEPSSKSNCLSESNISSKEKVLEVLETEQCSCDHSLQESLAQVAITDTNIAEETKSEIIDGINYVVYKNEHQMPDIMRLITKDLSEPYSIYTYRYFIHNWPKLCFLVSRGVTVFLRYIAVHETIELVMIGVSQCIESSWFSPGFSIFSPFSS